MNPYTNAKIELGMYRHFKGGFYIVVDVVEFAEGDELEPLLIYKNTEGRTFARTAKNFFEPIPKEKIPGAYTPRFEKL